MASSRPVLDDDQPEPQWITERVSEIRLANVAALASPTDFSACRTGLISDLLLRCGEGEGAAFEAVVDIFYSVVRAAAAAELPSVEVDGAVQRTFVAIWRSAPRYRPGGPTAVEWIMGHVVTSRADMAGVDLQGADL